MSSFPDLQGYSTPDNPPTLPGDTFSPPVNGQIANLLAPTIHSVTRQAQNDDSLIVLGNNLGTFTVYGQTTGGNGATITPTIQFQDKYKSIITLSNTLPAASTYLLWSNNGNGYSYPVSINRTETWWCTNTGWAGELGSVYGANLSFSGITPVVYIKQPGVTGVSATVTSSNPYKVDFTVPSTLATGDYQVWLHNGHGGNYGWGSPLSMRINPAIVWSGTVFNVRNAPFNASGDGVHDDWAAINLALTGNGNASSTTWSTVYLPSGTYLCGGGFNAIKNVRWSGDGKDVTIMKLGSGFSTNNNNNYAMFYDESGQKGHCDFTEIANMTLDHNQQLSGTNASNVGNKLIHYNTGANFVKFTKLKIRSGQNGAWSFGGTPAGGHIRIKECDIYGVYGPIAGYAQIYISGCNYFGEYDSSTSFSLTGGKEFSLQYCVCRDDDNTSSSLNSSGYCDGRIVVCNSLTAGTSSIYIANNTSTDLAPRNDVSHSSNSGEQILFEGGQCFLAAPVLYSYSNLIQINASSTNYANGYSYAIITDGMGLGQHKLITADNGSGLLTVESNWITPPDKTSTVFIQGASNHLAVYKNNIMGKNDYATRVSSSAGVQFYGNTINGFVDSNVIRQVRNALPLWTLSDFIQNTTNLANYNNLYINNFASGCINGIALIYNNTFANSTIGRGIYANVFRWNSLNSTTNGAHAFTFTGPTQYHIIDTCISEHNTGTLTTGFINTIDPRIGSWFSRSNTFPF